MYIYEGLCLPRGHINLHKTQVQRAQLAYIFAQICMYLSVCVRTCVLGIQFWNFTLLFPFCNICFIFVSSFFLFYFLLFHLLCPYSSILMHAGSVNIFLIPSFFFFFPLSFVYPRVHRWCVKVYAWEDVFLFSIFDFYFYAFVFLLTFLFRFTMWKKFSFYSKKNF